MWGYNAAEELLQFLMNILATTSGCGIHLYIVIRIVANYDKMSQYRGFIVVQSTVFFIDSVTGLLLNVVYGGDDVIYGLPFLSLSPETVLVLRCILEILIQIEAAVLAIFNIYRVSLFVRPRLTKMFYVIVVSTSMIAYACSLMSWVFQSTAMRYVSSLLSTLGAAPTIICYVVIRRHFRDIHSSDSVKRMQSKLSLGLLMQVILQLIYDTMFLSFFVFEQAFQTSFFADGIVMLYLDTYFLITNLFLVWTPALTGFLIKWSISGFFQRNAAPVNASPNKNQLFTNLATKRNTINAISY